MYLLAITLGLCVVYLILFFLFPFFFENRKARFTKKHVSSLALICVINVIIYSLIFLIPDLEWRNRFLHGLGGGFMAFFVCFLVARDSEVKISKFQFFVFSVLIVTALGVANEVIEFIGQSYFDYIFAPHINDTWLDLVSNTIGIAFASLCFVPFFRRK